MVGPSTSTRDRRRFFLGFKVGFALLVGVSMALAGLSGGASLAVIGAAFLGGTAAGGLLAWWILPDAEAAERLAPR